MPRPPKGVCVFCNSNGPLTDEDALMIWAAKILQAKGEMVVVRRGRIVAQRRRVKVIAPEALCGPCNNVWLGQMEMRFKTVMGRALNGIGSITLDREQQEFVALWTIKSALLLELAMRFTDPGHFCPVPTSVFHRLFLHKTPPPEARVWLGATGPQPGEQPRANELSNQPVTHPERQGQVGNVITFIYGNLVLKTFIIDELQPGPVIAGIDAPDIQTFTQIWPVRRDCVGWPPRALRYSDLDSPSVMHWPLPYRPEPNPPFLPNEPPPGFE